MKTLALFVALSSLLYCGPMGAADPDARALAEELLVLTNVEKSTSEFRLQLQAMVTAQTKTLDVPENMRDKLTRFQQQVIDVMFDDLSFANTKATYIDLYTSVFTAEELAAAVAFFKTPSGRAYADKFPVLMKQMSSCMQARFQALAPRLQKMTDDFMAELKRSATVQSQPPRP